jgi:phosphoribosylanthranilate isomerase
LTGQTWVKICGITNATDALAAVAMGADAVGFVFAPSPRQVTPGMVRDITRQLPREILTVGVFRDQGPDQVVDMCLEAGLRAAQLHGHETPSDARAIRPKVQAPIVALPAGSPSIERFDEYEADVLLLDGANPGSGEVFDWSLAESVPVGRRVVLAGGLTPRNVGAAITSVHPWGVDVSTGVEREPGRKDVLKMRDFVRAVRSAGAPAEPFDEEPDDLDDERAPAGATGREAHPT